jgi:hypothetical protein
MPSRIYSDPNRSSDKNIIGTPVPVGTTPPSTGDGTGTPGFAAAPPPSAADTARLAAHNLYKTGFNAALSDNLTTFQEFIDAGGNPCAKPADMNYLRSKTSLSGTKISTDNPIGFAAINNSTKVVEAAAKYVEGHPNACPYNTSVEIPMLLGISNYNINTVKSFLKGNINHNNGLIKYISEAAHITDKAHTSVRNDIVKSIADFSIAQTNTTSPIHISALTDAAADPATQYKYLAFIGENVSPANMPAFVQAADFSVDMRSNHTDYLIKTTEPLRDDTTPDTLTICFNGTDGVQYGIYHHPV